MNSVSGIVFQAKKSAGINIHKINSWILLLGVILIYMLLIFISNQYIFEDELYLRSYSDQLTRESIESILDAKYQYRWFVYIIAPIIFSLKISFATICISIGALLSKLEFNFTKIFKAALLAEIVFIIGQALYLINISFNLDTVTLETVSNYYPLTVLSYFGTENVVQWLQYPLQTLNLFEVFYMVAIAWLLSRQWKEDFMESLALVVPSYGTGLILWLVFVTFITLQIS